MSRAHVRRAVCRKGTCCERVCELVVCCERAVCRERVVCRERALCREHAVCCERAVCRKRAVCRERCMRGAACGARRWALAANDRLRLRTKSIRN